MRLPKRSRRSSNSSRARSTRCSTSRLDLLARGVDAVAHVLLAAADEREEEQDGEGETHQNGSARRMRACPRATVSRVSSGGGSRDHSEANSAPNTSTLAAANTNTSSAISAPSEP